MWKALGLLLVPLALCLLTSRAAAQESPWGFSADVALTRFWGASRGTSATNGAPARPYRPTALGLRLDRQLGGVRVAFAVRYAGASLGIEGTDLSVVARGAFDWLEIAPEIAVRIASMRGNSLHLFGGPVADIWNPRDTPSRTRIGGRAGLELGVPFGARLSALVRASAAVTGSVFESGEVVLGYERRPMTRAAVGLGLRVGL